MGGGEESMPRWADVAFVIIVLLQSPPVCEQDC